ncbi:hypothetical protein C8F01DRAFT_1261383 [Mycena amicta]|nr:hypothetical protein C8F01DRAFT_1261383 [Mycena amicta]
MAQRKTPKPTATSSTDVPAPPPPAVLAHPPLTYDDRNIRLTASDKTTYEDAQSKLVDVAGTKLLADQAYPITFSAAVSKNGTREYNFNGSGAPAVMFFMGEVCGAEDSTALGLAGNKIGSKTLASKTCVRLRIRIRTPTEAPDVVTDCFKRGLAALDGIPAYDEEFEGLVDERWAERVEGKKVWSSEILYARDPKQSDPAELITVVSEAIFAQTAKAEVGNPRKRARHVLPSAAAPAVTKDQDAEMQDATVAAQPGGSYPISLMEGHNHPMFAHMPRSVVQLNIRDVDGQLVKPWECAEKLKPGTLVIIAARPICYVFDKEKEKAVNKFYSLVMSSCRIMARAPTAAENHVPADPANDEKTSTVALGKRKRVDDGGDEVEDAFRRVFGDGA